MPTIVFTLKAYLDRLSALRADNIPTQTELAEACDMEPTPFSRMVNNRTHSIDKRKLAGIIQELNRRGHYPTFEDLFDYYP